MKKASLFLLFGLVSLSFTTFARSSDNGYHCYWMEDYSGKYEWIDTEEAGLGYMSKQRCYAMDSCDGGLGYSRGGCYKWARSAQSEREPWDVR